MRFGIHCTQAALERILRFDVPLSRVNRWLDDFLVDDYPRHIQVRDRDGHPRAMAVIDESMAATALTRLETRPLGAHLPTPAEPPCGGYGFTGRLPDQERGNRKIPGAAVCVHGSVPLLQRRSEARDINGACGPGARLRRPEGPR